MACRTQRRSKRCPYPLPADAVYAGGPCGADLTRPHSAFSRATASKAAQELLDIAGWLGDSLDVLPLVASTTQGTVECPWRLIGLCGNVLYITVYTRGPGSHPTSVWIEDASTHLTLHVIAPNSAATGTNSLAATDWEVHLATPLGNRLLCNAAGTRTTATSNVIP